MIYNQIVENILNHSRVALLNVKMISIFEKLRNNNFINFTAVLCIAYYITPSKLFLPKTHFILHIYFVNKSLVGMFTASQQQPMCDPFDIGVNPQILQSTLQKGVEDPNACLCTFPCTVDKVAELTKFYYIKRFSMQRSVIKF